MNCPRCDHPTTKTLSTVPGSSPVRLRECPHCKCRFTSDEKLRDVVRHGQLSLATGTVPAVTGGQKDGGGNLGSVSGSAISPEPSEKIEERTKTEKPSLHAWAIREFSAAYRSAYGHDYVPTPKDASQLGRMLADLKKHGIEARALPGMFGRYLRDNDEFATRIGHALWHFCTDGGLNKYRENRRLMNGKGVTY